MTALRCCRFTSSGMPWEVQKEKDFPEFYAAAKIVSAGRCQSR